MALPVLFAVVVLVLTSIVVFAHVSVAAARSWVVIARELDPRVSDAVDHRLVPERRG